MSEQESRKRWLRGLVEFALDRDVGSEIEQQTAILEGDPGSAQGHFNLGILHYSQRRVEDAVREFLAAIDCDPSFGRAYRKLGELYVNIGDFASGGRYAVLAADHGDRTLLEAFNRYPEMKQFVVKPPS